MIEMRPDQMEMFRERESGVFVGRVAAYLREAHQEVTRRTPEELEGWVRRQWSVAAGYGIAMEADVAQFIEISLAFGEDFHGSWKYPEAERILSLHQDGTAKTRQLLEAARTGFVRKT